ncbi:MAG: sulfatase [Roseibacillus sp.]
MRKVLSSLLLSFSVSLAWAETEIKKPNILMIAIDDLNDWVGFLDGHPQTQTPNMDRLAAQGMVFTNAHCAVPSCNPSRSAIMSGIAPWISHLYSNNQVMRESPVLKDAIMMPKYFSNHGYFSLSRGKIFHHADMEQDSWDLWSDQKKDKIKVPKNEQTDMTPYAAVEVKEALTFVQKPQISWTSTQQPKELSKDYQNAIWAAQWLTDHGEKKVEQPFFLACGIFRPHLPFTIPAEYFERIKLDKVTLPPIKEDYQGVPAVKPTTEYQDAKERGLREQVVWAYLASIAYADDCVGCILDALEESPYRDNTIVILWSDHGWHVGEKLRYKKTTPWERATRSPLIIKAPGHSPGRTTRPVGLIDLFPTLIDLADIPAKEELSGRSLTPLLKDPETKWEFPAITQVGKSSYSIRSERFRFIKSTKRNIELYDLETDPSEWNNLASDPAHAEVLKSLDAHLPNSEN